MQQPIGPPQEEEEELLHLVLFHHEELENFGDFLVWSPTEDHPEKLVQVELFIQLIEELANHPGETIEIDWMPFDQIIECVGKQIGVPFLAFHDASKNRMIYMGLKTYLNGLLAQTAVEPVSPED